MLPCSATPSLAPQFPAPSVGASTLVLGTFYGVLIESETARERNPAAFIERKTPGSGRRGASSRPRFPGSHFTSTISAADSEWTNKEWDVETNRPVGQRGGGRKGTIAAKENPTRCGRGIYTFTIIRRRNETSRIGRRGGERKRNALKEREGERESEGMSGKGCRGAVDEDSQPSGRSTRGRRPGGRYEGGGTQKKSQSLESRESHLRARLIIIINSTSASLTTGGYIALALGRACPRREREITESLAEAGCSFEVGRTELKVGWCRGPARGRAARFLARSVRARARCYCWNIGLPIFSFAPFSGPPSRAPARRVTADRRVNRAFYLSDAN